MRPLALAIALLLLAVPGRAWSGSDGAATDFVRQVQRGEIAKAKRLLDSSGFRHRFEAGDDVYFRYESGYDPNLAFLVGRPFTIGTPQVREQRSDWYLLDGTMYGTVTLPLRFDAARYQPWVLPAPIAFGRRMEFVDFMNFVVAPGADTERLSVRIRPSLEPGLITPAPAQFVAPPPPPAGPPGARPTMARRDAGYRTIFGPGPVDPAPVLLPSGEPLTAAQLGRLLPRLQAITLEISLMRSGRFASWAVMRWTFTKATVVTHRGEVVMDAGGGRALPEQQ
ncbi:MAG TPA: hypothetical protein VGR82_11270 [Methylomirabilota bacterium]|jgi:hypothetical protein|nr:hypothetical protein [Methylomirabilota bacterium]